MTSDPFAYGETPYAPSFIEDAACRAALKCAKLSPAHIQSASGLGQGAKLTFEVLVAYANFPLTPAVTDEPLVDLKTLITGAFAKSRLYKAWVKAWDARPDAHERALICRGSHTGFVILYESQAPPPRPHVEIRVGQSVLYLETLAEWCRGIEWSLE